MYYLITLLCGILIAVMVVCNGGLTVQFGVYSATVIIHIAGLILCALLISVRGERPFSKKADWYLYSGGAIGVAITAFNNLAFGRISISAILALGLFGQSIVSILIDQFGLMNMPKHPFKKSKLVGLILTGCGIAFMITDFEILAVLLSLLAGVNLVFARTINARLAENTSVLTSAFFNYLTGLAVAVPVLMLAGRNEPFITQPVISPEIYIYLGGLLGVTVVLISNMIVAKISSFYMTLFSFVGQIFAGLLLDILISGNFSTQNMLGGLCVSAGLTTNLLLERKQ